MSVHRLSTPPSMAGIYPRAVAIPLLRRLPLVGAGADGLPDTRLEVDVTVDLDHLSDYTEVCGFQRMGHLPATYPHVLGFPLAMRIMTSRSFPFSVLGLVHIENEITHRRPVSPDEPLSLAVHAEDLRAHDRGTQFDVVTEARAGDELVWEERSVYLRREGGGGGGGRGGDNQEPPPVRAHWTVPDDIGRRYGAVSGDRNLIHLHPLAARLFGMPRHIAHGMWVKARCLTELEEDLPAAFTVSARFKLPLFLPAEVAFSAGEDGVFEVRDASSGKPHLSGRLSGA
jgi:MaoC like domain